MAVLVFSSAAMINASRISSIMGILVFIAERLSSAMNTLGAEYAARSIIRDKRVHSL